MIERVPLVLTEPRPLTWHGFENGEWVHTTQRVVCGWFDEEVVWNDFKKVRQKVLSNSHYIEGRLEVHPGWFPCIITTKLVERSPYSWASNRHVGEPEVWVIRNYPPEVLARGPLKYKGRKLQLVAKRKNRGLQEE